MHRGRPDLEGSDFRARIRRYHAIRAEGWYEAKWNGVMSHEDWALYYRLARQEFGDGRCPLRRNGEPMLPRSVVFQ